jgi:nicotinamidase/pyrazinamidase
MRADTALLIIDVQSDFCPGGALPVPGGDDIIPLINQLAPHYGTVVATQDWHPPGHISFSASHPGHADFETIAVPYGNQILWPTHCVIGTPGAALHPALTISAHAIIRKGTSTAIDSYSAFLEADRKTPTGLAGYLRARSITDIHLAGLAFDFCVAWSATDARSLGFNVTVIEPACRAIDLNNSRAATIATFAAQGIVLAEDAALL